MWKESYRIGVDSIDQQHMKLFEMTDNLIKAVQKGEDRRECEKAIQFLKNYVVVHFNDEELYQASIGYSGIEEHRKAHRAFVQVVLDYEKRLVESDYELSTVKDLLGTLAAWLIYHVADADQRITKGDREKTEAGHASLIDCFAQSAMDALNMMAGLDTARMSGHSSDGLTGDVFVRIGLKGNAGAYAVFGFSRELAFSLMEIMTFTRPKEEDELVRSMLAEIANIVGGNAATALSEQGFACDIETPRLLRRSEVPQRKQSVLIDTGAGSLEIVVA